MSSAHGQRRPTVSAVVAAYQEEDYIADAIESILNQTRPPDEVVVVDDGSTDGTARVLAGFGDRIRVIRQENSGYQAAMNRAIAEARCDWVALCGADDVWEPRKLEWQEESILAHPEAEVFFGHFVEFGDYAALGGEHPETRRPPAEGLLPNDVLRDALLYANIICTPFVTMRRSLFERLGPFIERFKGDDYDYWFRCLDADVRFFYDPRLLGRHRRHDRNLTNDMVGLYRAMNAVRRRYEGLFEDRQVPRRAIAVDYFNIGRLLVDDRPAEARDAFRQSIRAAPSSPRGARAVGWLVVLSLPATLRQWAAGTLVQASRSLDARRGATRALAP